MAPEAFSIPAAAGVDLQALRRKVLWRIVPLIFVVYIVAYLDRVNAGFAKLQMQQALGFSDKIFGRAFGIFFAGYLFLEIPGALLVEHWSARKWFARILFTWGLCSMGVALVRQPWQFYLARFLLGLAEAGLFPGIVVYFTHWFPRAERGRAMAGMVLGIPVGLAMGAQLSGRLLEVHWFGLAGWQYLFLVEGLPAVVLAFVVLFALVDRPSDAWWLTPDERRWLEQTLEAERRQTAGIGAVKVRDVLRQPSVWLLAMGILATNTGGYALTFWLPSAIKGFLTATGRPATSSAVLNWTGLIYLCGLPGVLLAGRSSDRTGERKWHCVAGMVLTGVCLAASLRPGQPWSWVFACLCLTVFFGYFWVPPFWVLPTLTLSASAAAVAIGFINICANIAGLLGSPVVGQMKEAGLADADCLLFLASCYVIGGLIIALLHVPRKPTTHLGSTTNGLVAGSQ